jgi:hypothetical protein
MRFKVLHAHIYPSFARRLLPPPSPGDDADSAAWNASSSGTGYPAGESMSLFSLEKDIIADITHSNVGLASDEAHSASGTGGPHAQPSSRDTGTKASNPDGVNFSQFSGDTRPQHFLHAALGSAASDQGPCTAPVTVRITQIVRSFALGPRLTDMG